ncbi:hypothetical protein KUTG_06719 [Kutzneria sp. 744]|nr:hypothetical protein KUTG_06719 [Kutzneria sp. 744]
MAASHSFSIFLLKESFDADNALEDENPLLPAAATDNLPPDATLFVLDAHPRPPWWKGYFDIQQDLLQATKGALLFLPADGRVFALCFGHVSHNLKDESYEYDFGIRTTLNCVDPSKLKNTDTVEPGSSRRRRTQLAIESELTYFDVDTDSSVLKSLTGKVKPEHADLVKQVTGASSLRISTPARADELLDLCTRLLAIYKEVSYLTTFPNIQKITPVRDPDQIAVLNDALVKDVRTRSENVRLAVPDMVDYSHNNDSLYVKFSGAGSSLLYSDTSIDHYYEYLDRSAVPGATVTIERLKTHRLNLTNEFGDARDSHSVFKSLIYDTTPQEGGSTYYLNEGNWYEVDRDYVTSLQTRIDPFWSELDYLPECAFKHEGDYNESVGSAPDFVCLDKTNVSPAKQTRIEPCDLYTVRSGRATLIHVKISTGSSLLSHLFNQGANSVELLKGDDDAPQRLVALIEKTIEGRAGELASPIEKNDYEVVFAIITRKDPGQKSLNLPLFSRISLARNIKALDRLMSVPVSFGFVKHTAPPEPPKEKAKRPRKPANTKKAG